MMLIDAVRKNVPDLYLEHLARSVVDGYSRAGDCCMDNFRSFRVRENAIPWNRRGFIEDSLLQIPEILKGEATIKEIRNGWWWHVEVTIGCVVIAQAVAPDIDSPIRHSIYKSQLAGQTQLLLFADPEPNVEAPKIFAALTHGPRHGEPGHPAFAAVQIPKVGTDGAIVGYYDGKIDLMDEFPHVFGPGGAGKPEEIIEDTSIPRFLDKKGEAE